MLTHLLFFLAFVKADFDINGLTYHILESEENEVQLVNCSVTDSIIIIPSTVTHEATNYSVTSISSHSFSTSNITQFQTIYFPYTLKDIESDTFSGFENLKRIGYIDENNQQINDTLPPLITILNSNVFSYCKYISTLDLNNVVEIGQGCFQNSIRISNLKLRFVEIIGPYSLASIQLLQSIDLPSTLKEIQSYAFAATSLVNVTGDLPNLETIITGFFRCSDLVRIPKLPGILRLEDKAFSQCYNLKEIYCGSKLEYIYSSAFMGCSSLETFFTESKSYLISGEAFSQCSSLKTFNFEGPNEILNNAFESCVSLDFIDMSLSKIQSINWQVFQDCGDLNKVILPPQLIDFTLLSFEGCNIHSITFTGTNETLDLTEAFSHYNGDLFEVIFGENCDVILDSTFEYCENLSHVVLPKKQFSLNGTFSHCTNLTNVENLKNCISLYCAFECCYKLSQIDSLENLIEIGNKSFSYCSLLRSLPALPNVQLVGSKSFQYCFGIQKIEFGDNLRSIGESAFYGCYNLQSFKKNNLYSFSIGNDAFCNCFALESFDFTNCVEIGYSAFYDCTSLVEADMKNSKIRKISFLAFADCLSLQKVVFPNNIETIETSCFSFCENITSIEFLKTPLLFSIYSNAFEFCTSLQTVHFENQPFIIFEKAFQSCTSLKSIVLDKSSSLYPTIIEDSAFFNCTSLTNFDFSKWYLSEIGRYAFSKCPLSKTIKFRGTSFFPLNFTIYPHAFGSQKIKTIDFRFNFLVLSMNNQTFADCPNIKCIMVDNNLKDQFATLFKKNLLNGIHCPNYLTANQTILMSVIIGSIALVIIIIIIIVCVVKKKKRSAEDVWAKPLLTTPQNQYQ